ncbi:MAG TPA: diguanylate cyclase, partial [Rubrivivax sp.]|nr:diguanylate cyclase [Rubrivivax sp.]
MRDLRDREAARERIHHQAHHDALTGLPNRTAFMERLGELIRTARSRSKWGNAPIESMALLFIDLDHFKRVNDSLGHLAGDVLLRTVADRITGSLGPNDLVARFGGDEFMVLLTDLPDRQHVDQLAIDLLNAVQAPISVESWPLTVTPSIGIALFPQDGTTPEALVKNADTAMYQAKARGRAHHCFFDPVMASNAYADLVVEGELAQALERGEFELYFQPQVHASRRALVGAEALIRWNHPERGWVSPTEFIPIAEELGLIGQIGEWVLRTACSEAVKWPSRTKVAVNISPAQFTPALPALIINVLSNCGLPAERLELEITEGVLLKDDDNVRVIIERLKSIGVRLAL